MSVNHLEIQFPIETRELPFVSIIPEPTPVHRMTRLEGKLGHSHLSVKREDFTHSVYGGNKVRNLEFVLANAIANHKQRVITIVPKGSNFTAALSAHGNRLGLGVQLNQFVAVENPQIEAHFQFSKAQGAHDRTFAGRRWPSSRHS